MKRYAILFSLLASALILLNGPLNQWSTAAQAPGSSPRAGKYAVCVAPESGYAVLDTETGELWIVRHQVRRDERVERFPDNSDRVVTEIASGWEWDSCGSPPKSRASR